MKTLLNILLGLGTASSAFAASGALEDNSGILVWGFLALCGLIVAVQLIPTIMVIFGSLKAIGSEKEKAKSVS